MLRRRVGAAAVTEAGGGSIHSFDTMNHCFFISQMIVPGSNYWNVGFGLDKGDAEKDGDAIEVTRLLGQNMT